MRKTIISYSIAVALIVIVIVGFKLYKPPLIKNDFLLTTSNKVDSKNATYIIDGESVMLKNGYYEKDIVPVATTKEVVRYFGNETKGDFNNDGVEDAAFLITRNSGGSGIFYYVAALVSNGSDLVTTNTLLIGDRIAPQTTEYRDGLIIVNYADRKPEEPYSTSPSVGVSRYYKVVGNDLREVNIKMLEAEAKNIAEKTCVKGGESLGAGTYNENSKTWWFDANLNSVKEGCNPACVVSEETKTAEINWRCTGLIAPR